MTISYLFLVLFASSLSSLFHVRGEIHVVGDSNGWTNTCKYTEWTQEKLFHIGDTLVFNYEEGTHNVMQVNKTGYENCIREPIFGMLVTGNDSIHLTALGTFWYICGVGKHCEYGQKLSITVVPINEEK
ncbi:blue copper protein 1a-like [Telopea speciosissima]|uniref:blue copper protein 1a-like n=1 Tax=Telopea speciosissima TaxID=54955 RepID=UPI001CC82C7C|nr:blue copper protein 1a-like [Telopea speciosissima]